MSESELGDWYWLALCAFFYLIGRFHDRLVLRLARMIDRLAGYR